MQQSSLKYLRCVRCSSKLHLESYKENEQIDEGILSCVRCELVFPIIGGVPILWNNFANYLSNRQKLGGELFIAAKTTHMKSFVKAALAKASKNQNDLSIIEKRWTRIYNANQKSKFYTVIKKMLDFDTNLALEHGCSIGVMTRHLAKKSKQAFGIDKSYYAIREARKSNQENLDFFVADSMEPPFGKTRFDLILGLNLFELIEPKKLVKLFSNQIRKNGVLVLSDPYDYERGTKSIKEPLYEDSLREELVEMNFVISNKTKKPSSIQWNLKLHQRANLQYLVDLVIATK
ncbi:MAG: methyltransferase domain-containing protein [Candidatus Nitrosotenuis sp.]